MSFTRALSTLRNAEHAYGKRDLAATYGLLFQALRSGVLRFGTLRHFAPSLLPLRRYFALVSLKDRRQGT